MNLALKYRPKKFNEIRGQKVVTVILAKMVEKNAVPHALLFTGPRGVGKTSTARILAAELNKEFEHPSVIEIDAASHGLVDNVRALKTDLLYASEGVKVVILDEAHSMSREAFNALLKMIEEPPPNTVFALVTTEPGKIPATVRSRCTSFEFSLAPVVEIYQNLLHVIEAEDVDMDPALASRIAKEAQGSFRDSLVLLSKLVTGGILSVEAYEAIRGESDYGPALLANIMLGPGEGLEYLYQLLFLRPVEEISDKLIEVLRDLVILSRNGSIWVDESQPEYHRRKELSHKINLTEAVKCMKILWDLKSKLQKGDPARNLELCVVVISDIFKIETPTLTSTKASGRLTLEDIK